MPNTKRAAAYHETGHLCRAILANENAAVATVIEPDAHGWGGKTLLNKQLIPADEPHLCCIALAGFLTEAMGVAGNGNHSPAIAYSEQLLASVQHIMEGLFHQTLDPAWEVQVPLAAGGSSPGMLSRPDIEEIPLQQRAPNVLAQSLQETIAFLNHKQSVIDTIASHLESRGDIQSGPFIQWLIRKQ